MKRWLTPLFLLFVAGCHPEFHQAPEAWDSLPEPNKREQIVRDANELSRFSRYSVDGRTFSRDCSGFVGAVLFRSGIDVFGGASVLEMEGNGVRLLYEYVLRYGTAYKRDPVPGDLVFFSNTYARNRNQRTGVAFTHVGIVENVAASGTVGFVHRMRGRVVHSVMNLSSPDQHENPTGEELNSYLRHRLRHDPPGTRYLAGALFTAFGSLTPEDRSSMTPRLSSREE